MPVMPSNLTEIIEGIIALGAQGGEELFLPKIHSILCDMRSHDKLLAGLWFSITGSICYSRQVDDAIRDLAALGVLKVEKGSTAVVQNVLAVRARLRRIFPGHRYRKVLSLSLRFYRRLRGKQGISPAIG